MWTSGGPVTGLAIRGNSIFSNAGLGIDLNRRRCDTKRPVRPRHRSKQSSKLSGHNISLVWQRVCDAVWDFGQRAEHDVPS